MPDYIYRKPTHSAPLLLIAILLTLVAVVGHRFLPQRRLTIGGSSEASHFFMVKSGNGVQAEQRWLDPAQYHYTCQVPVAEVFQACGVAYMLSSETAPTKGIDFSGFRTLNLSIRYTGDAQYLRVAIRNFDPRFSKIEDLNSPKFNFVNIPTKDLTRTIPINLGEFTVAEWWTTAYDLPREYSRPDLTNATVFYLDLQGDLSNTHHDIQIGKLEFVGDWISAEYWYLGILSLWMILGTLFGTTQWVRMRRSHRAQRKKIDELAHEKDKYQKLSTIDALTNVLNRHGIDQFIEALGITHVSASVILVDLDHFKRINDGRGHHVGDQVLRTVGEILSAEALNTDAVGRWGGEEFVLVCPGASLAKAADLAEKLRQKIVETTFIPENPLPITASFGVATSGGEGFEDALRQADQALYLAKSRGRNCVVAAHEEQMHRVTGASQGAWALVTGRFKLHR